MNTASMDICYSLDVEVLPKAHVLKAWSPRWCYREEVELLGDTVLGDLGWALKGNYVTLASSLFYFLTMRSGTSSEDQAMGFPNLG